MKKAVRYLESNQSYILFLFIFSWVLTLKNKIGIANSWDDYVFHPDTPFWIFIKATLIFVFIDFIKRKTEKRISETSPSLWTYVKFFGISFIAYLIVENVFGIIISLSFDTISRNYGTSHQITYKVFSQIVDFLIFGGLSLAYLYSKDNTSYKRRISEFEISNSKSKIQQLKAQLNPHFLFNNLNVLDQLIEEDQEQASNFLSQFSELYRYVIKKADKELTTLQEELAFTQNYFELMEKRYQGYYHLTVQEDLKESTIIVPPFCIQVLIENAIVHNLGTSSNPVNISISTENGLKVSNNKIEKNQHKKGNGVALKNLSEQFQLLTNSSISIQDTQDNFTVILPFIKMNKND
ncbi:histidine kinase [Aquimarina litoralis]|nr:histidine kinase [Aquimarina litoralis]